jgi:hypothetical protein
MTARFRAISRFNTSPRKNFPPSDDGVDAVGSVRLRDSRWNLTIVFREGPVKKNAVCGLPWPTNYSFPGNYVS